MAVKVSLTGSVTGHTCIAAQVRLKHSKEVVCLAMNDSLLAVGSQSHITLVDPRKKTPVQDVESLDEGHGEETGPIIPSNTATPAHPAGNVSFMHPVLDTYCIKGLAFVATV